MRREASGPVLQAHRRSTIVSVLGRALIAAPLYAQNQNSLNSLLGVVVQPGIRSVPIRTRCRPQKRKLVLKSTQNWMARVYSPRLQ
jgi:hypothetical protein